MNKVENIFTTTVVFLLGLFIAFYLIPQQFHRMSEEEQQYFDAKDKENQKLAVYVSYLPIEKEPLVSIHQVLPTYARGSNNEVAKTEVQIIYKKGDGTLSDATLVPITQIKMTLKSGDSPYVTFKHIDMNAIKKTQIDLTKANVPEGDFEYTIYLPSGYQFN